MNPRPPNTNPAQQAKAARRIVFAMKGLSPKDVIAKVAEFPEHGREFYAVEFKVTSSNMGNWLRKLTKSGELKCHENRNREIVYYLPDYKPSSTPPNPIEEIFAILGTEPMSQQSIFKSSKYGGDTTKKILRELTETKRIEKIMIDKIHVAYRKIG